MARKIEKRNAARTNAKGRRAPATAANGALPMVSGRWLASAIGIAFAAALICAWGALAILFWQGSWQLLYHPSATVTRTPANLGIPFEPVGFAANPAGETQLRGWWIPGAARARFTAIYLHGADGNLSNTVNEVARLHAAGINVFDFDYRGYGQSHFQHPSEKRWSEDANAAIDYLTETRHVNADSIILVGRDLGANLALEVAAAHSELAGVVLEQPFDKPVSPIFNDARAWLVPARLLVADRYDPAAPASNLLLPSLWLYWTTDAAGEETEAEPAIYHMVPARKQLSWLTDAPNSAANYSEAMSRWLDGLQKKK